MYNLLCLLFICILLYKCLHVREHLKQVFSPLSNSEHDYQPDKWNKNHVKEYNNCYAYAMNDLKSDRNSKPHPGYKNNNTTTKKDFTCDIMGQHILTDYPSAYPTDFHTPCKCNYYKAYLAVDPKKDFHLYKQDSDGYWSHKPGSLNVTNLDASNQKIVNPENADRTYKVFDYTDSCMFFCVPSDKPCK